MSAPVAVITGASRGIGKQLSVDLAGAGYDIVAIARSSADSPSKLPGTVDETAHLVEERVAVNGIRLELSVWSEGYTQTLGDGDYSGFEDPVIMSDAVLWLAKQPLDYTGKILTIGKLREMGVVRPPTTVGKG